VAEQGIWRKRTDQELKELYKNLDTVADTEKKNFNIGHLVRMDS